MRHRAALVRVLLSGTVLGLAACGTSVVVRDNPASEPAAPAHAAASPSHQQDAAGEHQAASVAVHSDANDHGSEPAPMPAETHEGSRNLVPHSVGRGRERFAETAPVSNDGLTQISFAQEGEDFDPALTPDGRSVVFASTQHRNASDLFVKAINSSVVTQLTNDPADDAMPSISPDGKRVAFASNRGGNWNIYVMPLSGGKAVQITASSAHDLHPSWSPDSSKIVFCRLGEVSRRWELWVVEASNPSSGSFLGYGMLPQWSPKAGTGLAGGDRILFQLPRERGARTFGVWAVDYKDGIVGNATAIVTSTTSALINPTWSPDGRFIVYAEVPTPGGRVELGQTRPSQSDLWMIAADGSGKVRLTDGNAVALMPNWGSGNRLVFFSDRGGRGNIWTMDTGSAVASCGGQQAVHASAAPRGGQNHADATDARESGESPAEAKAAGEEVATAEEPKH